MIISKDLNIKLKNIFKKIEREVFKYHGQKNFFEIDLSIASEEEIKEQNKKLRDVDNVTDVLSSPTFDNLSLPLEKTSFNVYDFNGKRIILGSILICETVAKKNAKEYGHSFEREMGFLFCHSLLHLLGYDHIKTEDEKKMFEIQDLIMKKVGLNR